MSSCLAASIVALALASGGCHNKPLGYTVGTMLVAGGGMTLATYDRGDDCCTGPETYTSGDSTSWPGQEPSEPFVPQVDLDFDLFGSNNGGSLGDPVPALGGAMLGAGLVVLAVTAISHAVGYEERPARHFPRPARITRIRH